MTQTSTPKERPILFSAPMVRALLAGTKTQTRRTIKPQSTSVVGYQSAISGEHWIETLPVSGDFGRGHIETTINGNSIRCPFAPVGTRLWVRETWRTAKSIDGYSPAEIAKLCRDAGYAVEWCPVEYEDKARRSWVVSSFGEEAGQRRSPIHMPRWASRLLLDVVSVRVERLQEISKEDAKAEGLSFVGDGAASFGIPGNPRSWHNDPRQSYAALWDSIHSEGSWASNPFVWVVEFRRVP